MSDFHFAHGVRAIHGGMAVAEGVASAGGVLTGDIPNTVQPAAGRGLTLDASGKIPASLIPTPTLPKVVTGIIPATGTTPTAGTGFTYTHTNGTGIYVFTFTSAFSAAPVVVATSNFSGGADNTTNAKSVSTSGFTVETTNNGSLADLGFNFLAYQVS